MLVLSRRRDERILIGEGPNAVAITVVRIGKGTVKLGIDAPLDTVIRREELPPLTPTEPAQEGATDASCNCTENEKLTVQDRTKCADPETSESVPV